MSFDDAVWKSTNLKAAAGWKSSNINVVAINGGDITVTGFGKASITGTYKGKRVI